MRNERVFRKPEDDTLLIEMETQNRWIRMINSRLEMDIALTNKHFEKMGAMPRRRALQTWRGVKIYQATGLDHQGFGWI